MNAQQADSLRILADFLDAGVPGRFDMNLYLVEEVCGTRACALGWGTTIPALRERGLTRRGSYPTCSGAQGMDAAIEFFGIDGGEAMRLFGCNHTWSREWNSPKEAAAEMRLFLAEKGYYQAGASDAFERFKARILAPLPVTVSL